MKTKRVTDPVCVLACTLAHLLYLVYSGNCELPCIQTYTSLDIWELALTDLHVCLYSDDFRYDLQKGLRPRRAVRQAMAHGDTLSSNLFLDLRTAPVALWLSGVCLLFCAD